MNTILQEHFRLLGISRQSNPQVNKHLNYAGKHFKGNTLSIGYQLIQDVV